MKSISQNKLLLVFLIIFTLIGTICSSVHASSDLTYKVKNLDGLELTFTVSSDLRSNYKYVYITHNKFRSDWSDYVVCFSDVALFADTSSHVIRTSKDYISDSPFPGNYISWRVTGNKVQSKTFFSMEDTMDVQRNLYDGSSDILYSNVDVYDYNNPDKLVFQAAPQGITQALVEQATQLGMKPLVGIKEIILVVIVTIVGLIAFWKAWQLLSKQLRKA